MARRPNDFVATWLCWRDVASTSVVVLCLLGLCHTATAQKLTIAGLTIDQWQRRLQHLDPHSDAAVRDVSALRKLIRDPRVVWYTRRQAALTLARIGPRASEAVADLVTLLHSQAPDALRTHDWSLRALARFGPTAQAATPELASMLSDPLSSQQERAGCLAALARIGVAHAATVPTLIAHLQRVSRPADPNSSVAMTTDYVLVLEALGAMGGGAASAVPDLIAATRDPRERVRRTAAQTLGKLGRSAEVAIPSLVDQILDDDRAAVRDAAAIALPLTGPRATRAVRYLLEHDDPEVRWRAADAVPNLSQGRLTCQPKLLQMLQDPLPRVRLHAAESLWDITGQSDLILDSLLAGLQHSDRHVRMQALKILVAIGARDPVVAERLTALLKHASPRVRQAASSGLRQLRRKP